MEYYVERSIESIFLKASQQFPAVAISGPRQSGKTTLIKNLFKDSHQFVTFDDPLNRERAISDPQLFLENLEPRVILDEIQYVPELLSYIKIEIDRRRELNGRFIFSGSQQFHLIKDLGESLAGRIAILNLLPFDQFEKQRSPKYKKYFQSPNDSFVFAALKGSFPEIVVSPEKNIKLWYASYLQTYLERDVRSLANVGDVQNFQRFVRLLAARCGQVLNLSSFASDLGVSVPTIKRWLSILQASQIIFLLEPYYRNLGKRITKSPKIYFLDIGMVSYLTGVREKDILFNGPMAGPLFENFVIQEIVKLFYHNGQRPNIYYLRTHNQLEIDLIIEMQYDQILPVEIKLAKTLSVSMSRPFIRLKEIFKALNISTGRLISLADEKIALHREVIAMPLNEFLNELKENLVKNAD